MSDKSLEERLQDLPKHYGNVHCSHDNPMVSLKDALSFIRQEVCRAIDLIKFEKPEASSQTLEIDNDLQFASTSEKVCANFSRLDSLSVSSVALEAKKNEVKKLYVGT